MEHQISRTHPHFHSPRPSKGPAHSQSPEEQFTPPSSDTGRPPSSEEPPAHFGGGGRYGHNSGPIRDKSFQRTAALAGLTFRVESKHLERGHVTALLSGVTVDMRDAELAPEGAVLSIQSAMSGIDILVPASWQVVCEIDPVFGGVDGDRLRENPEQEGPVLRIIGSVVAGGLTVR